MIQLAPREVQQTHKLLNTGWALATVDNKTSGLVPINYVRRVESKPRHNQTNQELPEQQHQQQQEMPTIVPDVQPKGECLQKSTEIEAKSNEYFSQDRNRGTRLDTIKEIITNETNPPLIFMDNAMMPADLKDL